MDKSMKARVQHKHDVEANWLKATNFIPLKGEIIVYDQDENNDYPRIKIGNGNDSINNLPFITRDYAKTEDIPDNIVTCDLEGATEDETIIPDFNSNVNPVEKTEDMTQPVGVDASGKLWVAPIGGGSGGNFNITSDDDGNVIITSTGSVEITDDGAGNVIIK